ncbi:MAG: tetratricopeptide repeat protein [Endomicrobiales bacterium]|nr:tetratricopeptide repeat protein [Endomicrobiales bacterium]
MNRSISEQKRNAWMFTSLAGLLALLLFLAPLLPDIKLTRPKLLLLETGLYGILFLWLFLSFIRSKVVIRNSFILLPLFCYVTATAVFYYFSPDRHVALNELKRGFLSLTAYLVVANIVTSGAKRHLAIFFWLFGSFLAIIYGVLQYHGGIWFIGVPHMTRVMSTFGNPIFFAAHIVISLPIAIAILLTPSLLSSPLRGEGGVRGLFKLFLSIFIICGLLALYYTKTRAAFIGFCVSMLIFAWLNIKSMKIKYSIVAASIILFSVFVFLTKNIWLRQQEHLLIWRDALVMWSKNPWFGTGPGTFHIYFPQFASEQLKSIWPQSQFIVNDAHNEYIQYLSETGITGFGIFLWLLISFFILSYRTLKNQNGPSKLLLTGLFASSLGILTQNLFSVDMRFIISSTYLFMIFGFIDSFNNDFIEKQVENNALRYIALILIIAASVFSFKKILQPYIAQKIVASTPDFFDEKILEPAKTIEELKAIAEKYPDEYSVYEKLGWVYSKQKDWTNAIKNFEKAHELNPGIAGPLNNLGNIYFLKGNRTKAIEHWRKSLDINPSQTDSRLNLATAYYYNGQLKQATDELKKVLEIDPGNEKAIVMLKQMVE